MTEKEKAQKGWLYDANYNQELLKEKEKCQDLCHDFNQLKPSDTKKKREILAEILEKTPENFVVTAPFYCDFGYNIEIGEGFFSNYNCTILDGAKVTFGKYVFIAPNCCFSTAGHPLVSEQRNAGLEFAYPITVGNNVWFGAGVTVLPGVTIGDDVVIGAGSIVNKDIPSGVIAVGNPCRVLREITEEDKRKYHKSEASFG
ncbi:sugar O-acetyltransferase [Paenibacillus cucumis (ex Kampfer et al. 2016)]|uniref:Acetyltransferase n=1 Tax=Paenibacillus cucumis (ex Kampfer et al. 2016) TaxID=1776858 RepID=A0ABS7KLM1_9BACL|nr:sugar O-acetyltransferase [Paenibacillus cucumis (ex Kampfer et al. 2016)]MBY0205033.1 sugar O-acetyltransferase [Paenibacillus cucumis (ex Kampfer et al. 2016)]